MNIEKYRRTACGHMTHHYARTAKYYSNKNIDPTRTHLNYNLAPQRDCTPVQHIRKILKETPHLKRQNLVVMACVIVHVPKDLDTQFHNEFIKYTYEFLLNRYCSAFENPNDAVVSAWVHLDETTPHIHFAFIPVINRTTRDGNIQKRICAAELITRDNLLTLHPDFENYLNNDCGLRCKILNGATIRDAYGRAISVKELKKGTEIEYKREHDMTIGGRFR